MAPREDGHQRVLDSVVLADDYLLNVIDHTFGQCCGLGCGHLARRTIGRRL
jgi:hypothetical protein